MKHMRAYLSYKRLLLCLCCAILAGIIAGEYLLSNARTEVQVDVLCMEEGMAQLYYYSGNELAPFDEKFSACIGLYASDSMQSVRFPLPLARLRKLRLDVDGAEELRIQGISVSYLGKREEYPLRSVEMIKDCDFVLDGSGYRFLRTGEDPQLVLGDLRFPNIRVLYLSAAVGALTAVCVGVLLIFFQKAGLLEKYVRYRFLFEELVKRDFKKKYKRTVLGILWSMLNPLLMLLVMWLVFSRFFGQTTNHYVIYLFSGNIVFSFFSDCTGTGMNSLVSNSSIFTKVNIPKYMFLLSQSITSLINFALTLLIYFAFVAFDQIPFTWNYVCLLVPILCLVAFNIGIAMILSAMFVFFRDIEYLWSIFTMLLTYLSAIFYTIDGYSQTVQNMFLLNPVYLYIRYFRKIVIEGIVPSFWFHLLAVGYAALALGMGCLIYKKNNTKFLYYV